MGKDAAPYGTAFCVKFYSKFEVAGEFISPKVPHHLSLNPVRWLYVKWILEEPRARESDVRISLDFDRTIRY